MDYLIIVCLHSGNHCMWLREGARRLAWWHQPELRASFFVGRPLLARVLQSPATPGRAHRWLMGEGLGKAMWESGLRDVRRRRRAHATESTQDNVSVYRGNRRFYP